MKKLLQFTALSLLTISSAFAGTIEQDLERVIKDYESALNNSNTAQIMQLYSTAPIFMPQHAHAQVGTKAVEAAYRAVFETIDLNVGFNIREIEVVGDTAWARTTSAGATRILVNNQVVDEGNNELFIFKKEGDRWKIHRYLFATNQSR